MKKVGLVVCLFYFVVSFSQEKEEQTSYIDVQVFRGNIYKHTNDIGHLITGHPDGFLLSYNWKTFGKKVDLMAKYIEQLEARVDKNNEASKTKQ